MSFYEPLRHTETRLTCFFITKPSRYSELPLVHFSHPDKFIINLKFMQSWKEDEAALLILFFELPYERRTAQRPLNDSADAMGQCLCLGY